MTFGLERVLLFFSQQSHSIAKEGRVIMLTPMTARSSCCVTMARLTPIHARRVRCGTEGGGSVTGLIMYGVGECCDMCTMA